jgi:hypothetical protein
MRITFERLVSRNIVRFISSEMDLSGTKMTVNKMFQIMIIGGLLIMSLSAFILALYFKFNVGLASILGIAFAVGFEFSIYALLEFNIDRRKSFVDSILPDYLQLTAANIRSGIALDKSMLAAARPEFEYFSEDIKLMSDRLYSGETLHDALIFLGNRYRSQQLQRTLRMVLEAVQYGGGMTDLLNQIGKDIRAQATIQKEISGQLFMYTIFIAFAALIGAPVLYALTDQMISVTSGIWSSISRETTGNLTTTGVSFLKPTAPKITPSQYNTFALSAIILITGIGAFIVSVISSGSILKGMRYVPLFIIIGLVVFYVTSIAIGGIFSSISIGSGAAP